MAIASIEELRRASEQGIIRVNINFVELLVTLIYRKKAQFYSVVNHITVPPNSTVTFTFTPTQGNVAIVGFTKVWFDLDNALTITVIPDNQIRHYDPNGILAVYESPLVYYQLGALFEVQKQSQLVITNNTNQSVNFAYWGIWIEMFRSDFEAIIRKYFDTISQAFGIMG